MTELERQIRATMREDDDDFDDTAGHHLSQMLEPRARTRAWRQWKVPVLAAASVAVVAVAIGVLTKSSPTPPAAAAQNATAVSTGTALTDGSRFSVPTSSSVAVSREPTAPPILGSLGGIGGCGIQADRVAKMTSLKLGSAVTQRDEGTGLLTLINTGDRETDEINRTLTMFLLNDDGVMFTTSVALSDTLGTVTISPEGRTTLPFHIEMAPCPDAPQRIEGTYNAVVIMDIFDASLKGANAFRTDFFKVTVRGSAVSIQTS